MQDKSSSYRQSIRNIAARILRRARHSPIKSWLYSNNALTVYRLELPIPHLSPPMRFRVNDWGDLECFRQTQRWLTKSQFLDEARERLDDGLLIFTFVENSILVGYGWMVPRQQSSYFPYVRQEYVYPADSGVTFNIWIHPDARGRGLHQELARCQIQYAQDVEELCYVYAAVEDDNAVSHYVYQKLGFQPVDELYQRCRFGRTERGARAVRDQ